MTQHDTEKPQARWTRPHFRPGQDLTAEQLNSEQRYHIELLRRALHGLAGTGVVYGYDIKDDPGCTDCQRHISIGCGLAFDQHGRQLYWHGGEISIKDMVGDRLQCDGPYTLYAHYAEKHKKSGKRNPCHHNTVEWVKETVVFSLRQGCEEHKDCCPPIDNDCVSLEKYVCDRLTADPCIEHPKALCPTDHDDEIWYAAEDGIPLACVELCDFGEKCEPRYGYEVGKTKGCGHRPFVYRNDLLLDLIRGCHVDLVRVKDISFRDWIDNTWTEPVAWEEFRRRVLKSSDEGHHGHERHKEEEEHHHHHHGNPEEGFTVWFSKPVQAKTIHHNSVFLTAMVREPDSYFEDVLRIPVKHMHLINEHDDCAEGVQLIFSEDWKRNQIHSDISRFNFKFTVELTVRGSLIRDRNGCMLDGRPLDIQYPMCGQEMPGDDFIVSFRVAQRPMSGQSEEY